MTSGLLCGTALKGKSVTSGPEAPGSDRHPERCAQGH
jgi:hypothetical protein